MKRISETELEVAVLLGIGKAVKWSMENPDASDISYSFARERFITKAVAQAQLDDDEKEIPEIKRKEKREAYDRGYNAGLKQQGSPRADLENELADEEYRRLYREARINTNFTPLGELDEIKREAYREVYEDIERDSYVEKYHRWGKGGYIDVRFVEEGKYQDLKKSKLGE